MDECECVLVCARVGECVSVRECVSVQVWGASLQECGYVRVSMCGCNNRGRKRAGDKRLGRFCRMYDSL